MCALIRPKEKTLYIAWVGDSQALIANQGRVLQCVEPHKPCREVIYLISFCLLVLLLLIFLQDEKNRIEQEGGLVIFWGTWRVNGQLAVSRAIGNKSSKKMYFLFVITVKL